MKPIVARGRRSPDRVVLLWIPLLFLVGCATEGGPAGPKARPDAVAEMDEEAAAARQGDQIDASQLVADALEAAEAADELWQRGDLEGSLATLDLAYELLLQIPDDPSLIQQKDDLRHLISRRVVEIYRSRLTTAAELNSPIPVEINEYVEHEIKRFTGPERGFFLESYRRAGRYRPMIVAKLRAAGMPEELAWLPLVESGFKDRALSRAQALGMWQFISSTGSRYGLERSHWIDERMDPEKSTDAAIQYLTDLHGMFGDWTLALASYNCGEHRVMKLIRSQENGYLDRFWDLFGKLPRETARYVPRFLATLVIVSDPEKYGMELPEPYPALDFRTVAVDRHIRLTDLDDALGLERNTLVALNPELRHGTTPSEAYSLRVPSASAEAFETTVVTVAAYAPPPVPSYGTHRVRRGETLSTIARRYRTSVSSIVRANNLRSRNRIREGQRLKIPQRGGAAPAAIAPTAPPKSGVHVVSRGDSLWKLASRYGTTVDRIREDNGLRGDQLAVGQRLEIRTGGTGSTGHYTVRRGDTIGRIAAAQNVSIDSLLRANGLSRSSTIYPGQTIRLPE